MNPTALFWFRRDLRLHDQHGLYRALSQHNNVLLIFIFDPEILDNLPEDDARVDFIYNQLKGLNKILKKYNSAIQTYYGKPLDVFKKLNKEYNIEAVYTNHDYEPYALKRDHDICTYLKNYQIEFNAHKDQVIFEKNEVTKDDGLPYKVYTPYSKKWLSTFKEDSIKPYSSETLLEHCTNIESSNWVEMNMMGFVPSKIKITPYTLDNDLIDLYEEQRNTPSVAGTSRLGPHLRFGTVSIRRIVSKAMKRENNTFLKELIWREFFMQILWHFPHTVSKSFKPQYETIKWRNNQEEYEK